MFHIKRLNQKTFFSDNKYRQNIVERLRGFDSFLAMFCLYYYHWKKFLVQSLYVKQRKWLSLHIARTLMMSFLLLLELWIYDPCNLFRKKTSLGLALKLVSWTLTLPSLPPTSFIPSYSVTALVAFFAKSSLFSKKFEGPT